MTKNELFHKSYEIEFINPQNFISFFVKAGTLLFLIWDHSFSTLAKFSEKLTFLTPWYVSFSKNFANVLNVWSLLQELVLMTNCFFVKWNFNKNFISLLRKLYVVLHGQTLMLKSPRVRFLDLLFLIHISDLTRNLPSKPKLFVDVTSLFLVICDPSSTAMRLCDDQVGCFSGKYL